MGEYISRLVALAAKALLTSDEVVAAQLVVPDDFISDDLADWPDSVLNAVCEDLKKTPRTYPGEASLYEKTEAERKRRGTAAYAASEAGLVALAHEGCTQMGDKVERLADKLSASAAPSTVELSVLSRVSGYRRKSKSGKTVNVSAYTRKVESLSDDELQAEALRTASWSTDQDQLRWRQVSAEQAKRAKAAHAPGVAKMKANDDRRAKMAADDAAVPKGWAAKQFKGKSDDEQVLADFIKNFNGSRSEAMATAKYRALYAEAQARYRKWKLRNGDAGGYGGPRAMSTSDLAGPGGMR